MQIETIAIIRTSELNPQQMEAIRDVTYPADHEGDYWMVDVTILYRTLMKLLVRE